MKKAHSSLIIAITALSFFVVSCGKNRMVFDENLAKNYKFIIELSTSVAETFDPFVRVHVNDYRLSHDNKELILLDGALSYVVRFDVDIFAHKFIRWDIMVSPHTEIVIKTPDGSTSLKFYRGGNS